MTVPTVPTPVAPLAAPAIDWSANYAVNLVPNVSPVKDWQQDFVNHGARSEAQRNPNASLKIQVGLAPKLGAALGMQQPTV